MQTAQARQEYTKNGDPVSLATCIETLYFEQQYNGQVYRTSLNNRLLVVGNKLNAVSKHSISNALNMAQLPFYYITKIESDTASGLYRLDVSLWNIDSAVRATQIVDELNTSINKVNGNLTSLFLSNQEALKAFEARCTSTYVPLLGGKDANAYKNASLRGKVYRDLEGQLRREFGVSSYKAIHRNQTDKALEIISEYELPLCLEEQISDENAQMTIQQEMEVMKALERKTIAL